MQDLIGEWRLALDPGNCGREERWFERIRPEARVAPVPGIIQQVFPGRHGVAWYWHRFRLDRNVPDGERLWLCFGAVDYLAEVWLNGRRIFLKCSHTGNHVPIGQQVAVLPDHVRRDLINAKSCGFNALRFIAGVAWPAQLDFCDEPGCCSSSTAWRCWRTSASIPRRTDCC